MCEFDSRIRGTGRLMRGRRRGGRSAIGRDRVALPITDRSASCVVPDSCLRPFRVSTSVAGGILSGDVPTEM